MVIPIYIQSYKFRHYKAHACKLYETPAENRSKPESCEEIMNDTIHTQQTISSQVKWYTARHFSFIFPSVPVNTRAATEWLSNSQIGYRGSRPFIRNLSLLLNLQQTATERVLESKRRASRIVMSILESELLTSSCDYDGSTPTVVSLR